MFPFGWGLSYTRFAYSDLRVTRTTDGGLEVSVRVTNTGQLAGSTAPQVYLGAPSQQPAGIQFAVRQLSQFDRVTLDPGQSSVVQMHVPLRQLQYWSAAQPAVAHRGRLADRVRRRCRLAVEPAAARQVTIPASGNITCDERAAQRRHGAGQRDRAARRLVRPDRHLDRRATCSVSGDRRPDRRLHHRRQPARSIDVGAADDPLSSGTNVICDTTVDGNLALQRQQPRPRRGTSACAVATRSRAA